MTTKILFSLFLCGILLPLNAQIKGTVTDTNSNPIEFANVAIYSLPDSTLISGTTTDQDGAFLLLADNNNSSNALLRVSFIGYETQTVPALTKQTISLQPDITLLGEVVVEGDLPRIRLRSDAVVATVQNTVLSKAGTANDVLKRLPSITGDDGDFSIFGKGKAKIYVNNRELRDVSELDLISSADIKEVEIVHNPGAGYDASVKAVIRIHTVRKTGDGLGFDVRSTYLQTENTDLRQQLNLNYRHQGWDIFGTLKYERYAYIHESKIAQETFVDTLWTQKNELYVDGLSTPLTTIAGVNYEISPAHYAGMKYTMTAFPGKNGMESTTLSDVYANGTFYDRWESSDRQTQNSKPRHRLNAYYNGKFEELKVDFNSDFYRSSQSTASAITESSQEYDDRIITSDNRIKNHLFATRLVLSYPLLEGQLSVGNEYTRARREDDYITDIQGIPSTNTSIHDDNNAFFAEYSRSTSIGQITAGVRFENVYSDYYSDDEKMEEQSRHYARWFPNISYSNTLGGVQMQLSYTAKTVRPAYWQLGSSIFYANRFTMQTGNPFLKPTLIHDASLTGSWKFLQLMVSYKQEKDVIMQWATQMEENPAVTLLSTRNVKNLPSLTAYLTASPKFGIWAPQATIGFMKQWLTITSNDQQVRLNSPIPPHR
ncbi:MAG: TonB-dependent receptor [Proteiniphilum sp.]|nr:TonB-dependent receptor [Proteiniphilum sp.]